MMEAVLILATIALRYQLKLVAGHSVTPMFYITLRPKERIKVGVASRGGPCNRTFK
jgi:hypothetical protein